MDVLAPSPAERFLRACRREATDATPVWFMRQAGRSLPEYREVRRHASLQEITRNPALCAEVTLQPVRRLGVDAAVLFADITTPLPGIGVGVEIVEGRGPVVAAPIRTAADVARLRSFDATDAVPGLLEAIRLIRAESPVPLIGFAGAPFTLASYLVDGGASRDAGALKRLLHEAPEVAAALFGRLVDMTVAYVAAQIEAGVQAVQLFDSWVGTLSPLDYREAVLPHMRRLFGELRALPGDRGAAGGHTTAGDRGAAGGHTTAGGRAAGPVAAVPLIHFGTATAGLLELMAEAGGDVIGLDWRVDLGAAWARVPGLAVQGNLDPALLLGPWDTTARHARAILGAAGGRPGHIFNLGHGVLPETDPDDLRRLVDLVHDVSSSTASVSPAVAVATSQGAR